jgi:hypothetical protein
MSDSQGKVCTRAHGEDTTLHGEDTTSASEGWAQVCVRYLLSVLLQKRHEQEERVHLRGNEQTAICTLYHMSKWGV